MARRGNRMAKTWTGGSSGNPTVVTSTQILVASVFLAENSPNQTVLRSRGSYFITATPDAAADTDVVGLGLIVVHTNAASVGGTSLPGPLTDIGADWLWHSLVQLDAISSSSASSNSLGTNVRDVIDSKAMRRFLADHAVVLVAQLATGDFSEVTILAGLRILTGE